MNEIKDLNTAAESHRLVRRWIALETNRGVYRVALKPTDEPKVEFILTDGECVVGVYAYCNLHGLWKAE